MLNQIIDIALVLVMAVVIPAAVLSNTKEVEEPKEEVKTIQVRSYVRKVI